MLSVSSPLASAAERGASRRRLRTTLLPRRSSQVAKPAQAGALTTPLPESCRAASSARIAPRALWSAVSLAFVAYEASSAVSALPPWSAVTLASRLASCAATKASVARPSRAFAIWQQVGVSRPPRSRGTLLSSFLGQQSCFYMEAPGRRLQRAGPRKLYQLARQRDLDVTQAMALEALKADVGRQVQAPRPRALGKGPNDRLQADLINFSQNTRGKTKYGLVVMDVFTREAAVEPLQNKNAETVGHQRAARELTGDDGNFVVTTDRTKRATTSSGRPGPTTAPRDGATPTSSSTTRTSPTGA